VAELTKLESKLAEVLGLAGASRTACETVKAMLNAEENELAAQLDQMRDEARETERRCTDLASQFDRKKTAILAMGKEIRNTAAEMMSTYLEGEDAALDGYEFLTMAEAGEVGHWAIVKKFNERAVHPGVTELVQWAIPIQERHLTDVLAGSLHLAGQEDPNEISD
jgi:hypothetical protein